jgi:hypothetical protein
MSWEIYAARIREIRKGYTIVTVKPDRKKSL